MRRVGLACLALTALVLSAAACGSDEASQPAATGGQTTAAESPGSAEETRAAILAAGDSGSYDGLRELIEADTFLSDFGFGEERDPVGRWEEMGPKPLRTMAALLRMSPVVRETNEGTLHEWPDYDPDSQPSDLTAADRKLFRTFLSEDELEQLIVPELGYTGPRLGILADGTWWFFILQGGP
jgi:hypothetical protein